VARLLPFPYSKADPAPAAADQIATCSSTTNSAARIHLRLASGAKLGPRRPVLEYNQDPAHLRDLLLYELTLEAQKCLQASALSKRE